MKLTEALQSDVRIRLVCKGCGAHQPAYVNEMIDKHGPETELDVALRRAKCFFCDAVGEFTAFVSKTE